MIRKTAAVAATLGLAFLLSGCVIVPVGPYYYPHHYRYYGWR